MMIKQFKYMLGFIATISSYTEATTCYFPGLEGLEERSDSIRIGSSGGFEGFTMPSSTCKSLYITFTKTASPVEPNSIPTNSYRGTGDAPKLPNTLKDIYLVGDASDFPTLVVGNTRFGPEAPAESPSTYALPTPAVNTNIHFLLTRGPTTSPLLWFQDTLPGGCRLIIEPGSADPFINVVLPLNGGDILIGAPVSPAVGFSHLLASMTRICDIQRHPKVPASEAYLKAVMTLQETTVFPGHVNGISLSGAHPVTFEANSDLVDPAANSAGAGYVIATKRKLELYSSHAPLPAIASYMEPGGTSKIIAVKKEPELPITSLKRDKK